MHLDSPPLPTQHPCATTVLEAEARLPRGPRAPEHRDGIRGYWFERNVPFDAALLKAGTNVLKLTNPARSWVDGVLYDYLRLELDESSSLPKE